MRLLGFSGTLGWKRNMDGYLRAAYRAWPDGDGTAEFGGPLADGEKPDAGRRVRGYPHAVVRDRHLQRFAARYAHQARAGGRVPADVGEQLVGDPVGRDLDGGR